MERHFKEDIAVSIRWGVAGTVRKGITTNPEKSVAFIQREVAAAYIATTFPLETKNSSAIFMCSSYIK